MFLNGKKRKQEQNKLTRKVDALLLQNFFAQEDFLKMSKRQALKVIKTIARIEGKKISRSEALELYLFIVEKPKLAKITAVAANFFGFVIEHFKEVKKSLGELSFFVTFVFNFRLNFQRIFRI